MHMPSWAAQIINRAAEAEANRAVYACIFLSRYGIDDAQDDALAAVEARQRAVAGRAVYLKRPFEPQDPNTFHITLAYFRDATDEQVKRLQEELSLPVPFIVTARSLRVFPPDDKGLSAVVLDVVANPALLRIQSEIINRALSMDLKLGDFADPAIYSPHITLGYSTLEQKDLPADIGPFDLWVRGFSITRQHYDVQADILLPSVRDRGPLVTSGGPGSGHFGHKGRPGEVGGSAPSSGLSTGEPGKRIVKVLSVVDTRKYEEGDDDKWHAIAGSGEENFCARCGRVHEVHATVELEDGSRIVVGTTCARAEFSEAVRKQMQVKESAAKRLRVLESELEAKRKYRDEYRAAWAQVSLLPLPDVTIERETTPDTYLRFTYIMGDEKVWGHADSEEARRERIGVLTERWRDARMAERGFKYSMWFEEADYLKRIARAKAILEADVAPEIVERGGPGSGHFEHAGRPGEVGGSAPSGGLSTGEEEVRYAERRVNSEMLKKRLGIDLTDADAEDIFSALKAWASDKANQENYAARIYDAGDPDIVGAEVWLLPDGSAVSSEVGHEGMARHAFADYAHEKLHRSIGEETEGIEEELFVGLGAVRITTGGAVKGVSPRGMAGFTWDSTIIPTPKQRSVLLDVAKTYKEAGGNLAFETVNGSEKYPDHGGLMREEDTDSTRAKEFARLRASLMGFAVSSGVTVARSEWPEWALALTVRGGPGSGHHGHRGIPGHRGGSMPSGLSPEATTDVIAELLSPEASRKVMEFRDKYALAQVEYGWVVKSDGTTMDERTDNKTNEIMWPNSLCARMKGKVLVHNHPSGKPFSAANIVLMAQTGLRGIVATGRFGTYIATMDSALSKQERLDIAYLEGFYDRPMRNKVMALPDYKMMSDTDRWTVHVEQLYETIEDETGGKFKFYWEPPSEKIAPDAPYGYGQGERPAFEVVEPVQRAEVETWMAVDFDNAGDYDDVTFVTMVQMLALMRGEKITIEGETMTKADGPFLLEQEDEGTAKSGGPVLAERGGPGSGHHKHKGIPGHRGGSAPSNLPPAEPSAPAYRQASGLRPAILILNPPRTPKYARVVSALEAIARVHGAPMANIPLVAQRSRTKGGSYKRVNLTHEPIEIGLVLGKTEALGIATVHEFGHYMDDWGLGYGFFASLCPDIAHLPETPLGPSPYEQNAELRDALDEWYEAVSQSKAAKGLERGLFNSAMATRITAADGTVSVKVTRESGSGGAWKWRNNVMQRHEYFARSYSQYIALRGGDVGLKAEIDTALREYHEPPAIPGYKTIAYTQYWEWDDFKPIASAFDKIFRSTQWASQ